MEDWLIIGLVLLTFSSNMLELSLSRVFPNKLLRLLPWFAERFVFMALVLEVPVPNPRLVYGELCMAC